MGETWMGMHRRAQRWRMVGLAVALLASSARADEPRLALYYGPDGPLHELLGAELGLVGFELRPGPAPAPIDRSEALALFEETGAEAIVDHHQGVVALWVRLGERARRAELSISDDPGIAPLVIAETLRAATEPAPAAASPTVEPRWAPPPPRIATEPPPAAAPAPDPEPAPGRWSASAGPYVSHGGRWTGGVALEASVRLHPALSLATFALLGGAPALGATLRVDARIGALELFGDAGPAVWWRQRPTNDGSLALRASPSWTAGLGATLDLDERWAMRGRVGLLRAGPRHRKADQEATFTLSLTLGARF